MKAIFLIFTFIVSLSAFSSAQEQLTEADYNVVLAKALDKASSRDRRILTQETFYTGSQVSGTRRIVSHFSGPDAKKIEVAEEFGGKVSRSDAVRIGAQHFCREGDKKWKQSDKECAKGGKMMAIPDGNYEYFVETNPSNSAGKLYTRRAAFTDSGSPERDAVRLKFIEIKFSTDESGAITQYAETRRGGLEPNGWSSHQVTHYDYQPAGLKVTVPANEN
jgi:hypothetical protein